MPWALQCIFQGDSNATFLVFCAVANMQLLNVFDAWLCQVFWRSAMVVLLHPHLLGHSSLEVSGGTERQRSRKMQASLPTDFRQAQLQDAPEGLHVAFHLHVSVFVATGRARSFEFAVSSQQRFALIQAQLHDSLTPDGEISSGVFHGIVIIFAPAAEELRRDRIAALAFFSVRVHIVHEAALLLLAKGLLAHQQVHVHRVVELFHFQCCKLTQVQLLLHVVERAPEQKRRDAIR